MALAIDGSNTGSSGVALVIALTTSNGSGLICAACRVDSTAGAVVSVTAPGLSFTQRTAIVAAGTAERISNWYAPYTTNFSGNITITPTSPGVGGTTIATVFGISGAPTSVLSSSFDPNAPTTNTNAEGALSLTTVNARDVVFTNYAGSLLTTAAIGGWTGINTGSQLVEYQILTSAQTVTGNFFSGTEAGGILDAVVAATFVRLGTSYL